MKQIGLAVLQYAQDYDEKLPLPVWHTAASGVSSTFPGKAYWGAVATYSQHGFRHSWVDDIDPYVKSEQVFYCPSDGVKGANGTPGTNLGEISYGYNIYMTGYNTPTAGPVYTDGYSWMTTTVVQGERLANITATADKVLLADASHNNHQAYTALTMFPPARTDSAFSGNPVDVDLGNGAFATSVKSSAAERYNGGRHFGGANVTFADGHVKFMKASEPGLLYRDSGTAYTGTCPSGNCGTNEWVKFWHPAF